MKRNEVRRISKMMHDVFDGAAWHGPSIMEVLNKISPEQAFKVNEHIRPVCELVRHMISWKIFATERLKGHHDFEITKKENWDIHNRDNPLLWNEILDDLKDGQKQLIDILENTIDEKLMEEVEGKAYNYYTLLHGVIQHDLYHLGEIVLLSKL